MFVELNTETTSSKEKSCLFVVYPPWKIQL